MGACVSPFQKEHLTKILDLPCGKCYECKTKRVSAWAFRLQKQAEISISAFFITITYAESPRTKNNFQTISKIDVQKFFKRLRKTQETKIKYYAVGEYGSKTKRPHYHLIIFNLEGTKDQVYNKIEKAWSLDSSMGHIHIGELNVKTIAYTLKYISKESKIPLFKRDDRLPEFSLMSKGMGKNYLTPQMIKYHRSKMNDRFHVTTSEGFKIAIPRYYKDRIYTLKERQKIGTHFKNNPPDVDNSFGIQKEKHRKFTKIAHDGTSI
jgi:hypothetical protein